MAEERERKMMKKSVEIEQLNWDVHSDIRGEKETPRDKDKEKDHERVVKFDGSTERAHGGKPITENGTLSTLFLLSLSLYSFFSLSLAAHHGLSVHLISREQKWKDIMPCESLHEDPTKAAATISHSSSQFGVSLGSVYIVPLC